MTSKELLSGSKYEQKVGLGIAGGLRQQPGPQTSFYPSLKKAPFLVSLCLLRLVK